ncbi:unnamed protein product, partial [Meganyctiphanes norvegica]
IMLLKCLLLSLVFVLVTGATNPDVNIDIKENRDVNADGVKLEDSDNQCTEGTTWPDGDGCNTCSCFKGQALCTWVLCNDECTSLSPPGFWIPFCPAGSVDTGIARPGGICCQYIV